MGMLQGFWEYHQTPWQGTTGWEPLLYCIIQALVGFLLKLAWSFSHSFILDLDKHRNDNPIPSSSPEPFITNLGLSSKWKICGITTIWNIIIQPWHSLYSKRIPCTPCNSFHTFLWVKHSMYRIRCNTQYLFHTKLIGNKLTSWCESCTWPDPQTFCCCSNCANKEKSSGSLALLNTNTPQVLLWIGISHWTAGNWRGKERLPIMSYKGFSMPTFLETLCLSWKGHYTWLFC